MSYSSLLIQTCDIQRYTDSGAGNYNRPTKSWADLHASEPCRFNITKGNEIRMDNEIVISYWTLFVGDIDVTERDRVIFGGETYEIVLIKPFQNGSADHHKELILIKAY